MDGWMDRQMHKWMGAWVDGWMDQPLNDRREQWKTAQLRVHSHTAQSTALV